MLYSISKKSSSRHKIRKIKKIRAEASKNTGIYSIEDWDYDSSLAINSIWDKDRRPDGCKDINKLDNIVTNNINDYNDQNNEAIDNEPTLDNNSFSLYRVTSDPLPVLTVSL